MITKEIQEKIEAAADKRIKAAFILASDGVKNYTGPSKDELLRRHNDKVYSATVYYKEGANGVLKNPREFGLVPLSEVEGLVTVMKRMLSALEPPHSPDCPWNAEWIKRIKKALQDFEKKGE